MIARLPGVWLGYDDSGRGVPLLLLHGFPHDRSIWGPVRQGLAGRARCIAPDLRGFGESTTHGPFSMDQYADDLVALLDRLQLPSVVVAGLSMGGYIAFALWRRYPARVRALVLCDTRADADDQAGRRRREELVGVARREGARAIAQRMMPGMVGATTRARRPEVVQLLQAVMTRQPVAGIAGALHAMRDRPDSRATLETISVPVLVLVGEEDALTPVRDAEALAAALPAAARARLEVVAEAGHVACLERPSATTHALADFLATLDRPPSPPDAPSA
jgi:pimeloyl-ACP methyl ester carboxylesterase